MPWGAAVGAVVGAVANKALAPKNKSGLEAGESKNTKEPWAEAVPWLKQNLAQGQELQNQYMANPFSPQQKQAYANQYAQSDYVRQLVPGLLGQMQNQQVGFDREKPTAKPNAWNWLLDGTQAPGAGVTGGGGGLLGGMGSMTGAQGASDAQAAAAKEAAAQAAAAQAAEAERQKNARSYGQFTYGMGAPQANSQAFKDMQTYFANGGKDWDNQYGWVTGNYGPGGKPQELFPQGINWGA
jgi:hypothetical protein